MFKSHQISHSHLKTTTNHMFFMVQASFHHDFHGFHAIFPLVSPCFAGPPASVPLAPGPAPPGGTRGRERPGDGLAGDAACDAREPQGRRKWEMMNDNR